MIKLTSLKTIISIKTIGLIKLLVFSYLLSLLGGFFYFFDLFSHFALQYAIGGLILGAVALSLKLKTWGILALFIACISMVETRVLLDEPFRFSAPNETADYTFVTFNHNYARRDFPMSPWLLSEDNDFDVIVLQEATTYTALFAQEHLSKVYPYQIHEPADNPFGMVIISKYKFVDSEKIILDGPYYQALAIKLTIQKQDKEPVTLYALHPHPPAGVLSRAQRNYELFEVSRLVSKNEAKNIVMIGDWNITPFDSAFGDMLRISGLNYQSYGFMHNPTWPSFNVFTFLKIPIDHALYSDNLLLVRKDVGPSFLSDHHALIVGVSIN